MPPLTRQAAIALRRDPDAGIARLRRLAAAGEAQACRQLAFWLVRSGGGEELERRTAAGDRFARRELSDWLVGQRRHDEAIEVLRPLAEDHVGSRRRLARLLAGRGRVDEAAAVLAAGPDDAWTTRMNGCLVAEWLTSQGRVEQLRPLAAGGDSRAAAGLHRIVVRRWAAGRLAEAIPLLAELRLREDGRLPLAARDCWRSERRLPLRDRAIELLDGVDDPLCRRTRARLLRLQRRHADAAAAFRELADAGDTLAADELAAIARRLPVPRELPALPHLRGGHVHALAYGPDVLVAAAPNGGVLLWDHGGGTPRSLEVGWGGVAVSPDGALLARANGLWRLPGGEPERDLMPAKASDRAVAFSPDGRLLGSGHLWDVAAGTDLGQLARAWTRAVAFSPDGGLVAVASSWPVGVRVREVPSRRPVRTLQTLANALAFQPGGHLLATAGDDAVRLWGPANQPERVLAGGAEGVAFSPDGTLLATVRREGWQGAGVRLWRPATGELLWTIDLGADAVAFSPAGTELATASAADALVRCWDVAALLG
jgi:WD domain, G-beta repeat